MLYACRIPERWFPGKCDILFHSHQIFHTLVVLAAFTHFHGLIEMSRYRLTKGFCIVPYDVDGLILTFEENLNETVSFDYDYY